MPETTFAGDRKRGEWVLARAERRLVAWAVPRVPSFLETYHLTLLTLAWSAGIVAAGFLALDNLHWLWLSSGCIALQYLTDVLDGAVGRHRGTGLIKWGYYMDHLLDYVFLAAIISSYGIVLAGDISWYWFLGLLALGGAFMVNMFLAFAATNEFRISVLKIGPTEMRLFFVLVNTGIIFFGTGWVATALPYVTGVFTVALVVVVFLTQKRIWELDMEAKRQAAASAATGVTDRPA